MRFRRFLLFALLFTSCGQSTAQGCSTPGCIPPIDPRSPVYQGPGGNSGPVWRDRWGAISLGGELVTGADGLSSKRQAERAALSACRAKGGSNCEVILTYNNGCGVMVWGKTQWQTVRHTSIEAAAKVGKERCSKVTEDCQVYYASCSLPQRVR